jgi:uncharacterized membrane protein (UPF0127 family)
MSKTIIVVSLILICLVFIFYYFRPFSPKISSVEIDIKNTKYTLEVANTPSQQTKGLSNRTSLCSTCGMIFVFRNDGIRPFWMKDTLIPLDMIWLNHQDQVVFIQTAEPQLNIPMTQLKIYQNSDPAQYVIELNAGDANKLNLKEGDTIKLPNNL